MHSEELRLKLQQCLTSMVDAETGQRGFILTADEEFLERFHLGKRDAIDILGEIEALAADTDHAENLPALRQTMEARLSALQTLVAAKQSGIEPKPDDFREGKRRMDIFRRQIANMRQVEEQNLEARKAAAAESYNLLSYATLLATLVGVAIVSVAALQVRSAFRNEIAHTRELESVLAQLRSSEHELRSLNETLEKRVEERTAQLQEINEELKAFSSTIAHDLRAPLRGMLGFAQALKEDNAAELNESGREYIEHILSASRRMDLLIRDLLAYSRLSRDDLRLAPATIRDAVDEAMLQIASTIKETDAHVEIDEASLNAAVLAHAPTLVQAIVNLLSNAVKFVAPGTQPRVKVWGEAAGRRFRLHVADNGIGIAPEHHARIFRPFERLHGIDRYPGTGIGLAIVRKAAERMNGTASVESSLGKGSRFSLELNMA
ncbi:MAG TPA: ATP-binding protein [Planctomycetota bacterium]|nr:ATP-binding protein [Planctomycetota bacterium]